MQLKIWSSSTFHPSMPRNPCVYISPVVIPSLSWKLSLLIPPPQLNWKCSSKTTPQINTGTLNTERCVSTQVLLCLEVFWLRRGSCTMFYAPAQFGWIAALGSVLSPCPGYTPSQQLANCFQINLSPCLVCSALLRNSPCFVLLLSPPLLPAVHSAWTLSNSLQVMVVSPVPTPPSKCQASLRLETAKKTNDKLWHHLPWDFLPFFGKNLDSPKYPHQPPVFSSDISFWGLPSKLWVCFPRTTFRLLLLSQLFPPQYQCGCHLQ